MVTKLISTGTAIRDGIAEAGKHNKNVILFAEGLTDPSSVYGTTKDLGDIFSSDRMIEMPIAENGLCGVAIGAALMGKRPVISFHRVEFALLAIEQIFNNAAKAHYISNGQHSVPLVIRAIIGRGWGQGPEHSQSLETLFAYIPGLKVIMPTFPNDAKGMIISAIEDNSPVIVLEHRWCHYIKGDVEEGYIKSDLIHPKKIKSGTDFTIVASSFMTVEALQACELLEKYEVTVDLFDLRILRPLNLELINESVSKTGRLMTVDTGFKTLGIGAEIVSQVTSANFNLLKSAPIRLGLPDHPIPSSVGYIDGLYVDASIIFKEIANNLGLDSSIIFDGLKFLSNKKSSVSLDVPDPSFQGPF